MLELERRNKWEKLAFGPSGNIALGVKRPIDKMESLDHPSYNPFCDFKSLLSIYIF